MESWTRAALHFASRYSELVLLYLRTQVLDSLLCCLSLRASVVCKTMPHPGLVLPAQLDLAPSSSTTDRHSRDKDRHSTLIRQLVLSTSITNHHWSVVHRPHHPPFPRPGNGPLRGETRLVSATCSPDCSFIRVSHAPAPPSPQRLPIAEHLSPRDNESARGGMADIQPWHEYRGF